MATKKNEIQIDELLDSVETKTKTKDNKASNQASNDWGENDEGSYEFKIVQDQQASKKTQKKKNTTKGWAEAEAAQKDQPKTTDFAKIQEDQKKKVFRPPGSTVTKTSVNTDAEYFPSLGEERPKQAPKRNPEPVPAPVQQTPSDGFSVVTGPKKFVNAKKTGAGETFAPLNPSLVEKEAPVAPVKEKTVTSEPVQQQTRPSGVFQRSTGEQAQPQPQEPPSDSKFKFGGGEGPRKFVGTGSKISFKREEEKNDNEALRLQKEREMEERILREKEELAKQRELRDKKRVEGGEKKSGPSDANEDGEKRIARFSNVKKEGDKHHAPHADKQQPVVVEEPQDTQPAHAKEVVEMHGALTNKGWGDGPLRKVKK